jgi:hypothetical protein
VSEQVVVGHAASAMAGTRHRAIPGDGLLHPVVIGAILALLVNDQLLKGRWPGLVTGKISDIAGLVLAPLLLVAVAELIESRRGHWREPRVAWITAAVVATGIGFAAVKLTAQADTMWEGALGIVQWPISALADVLAGRGLPPVRPIVSTADATDLVAIAAVWVAHAIGRRRVEQSSGGATATSEEASAGSLAVAGSWWYELAVAGLGVGMLAGATIDGWAHTHDPRSLETILTPWHAIVYVSFVLVAFLVLAPSLAARLEGRDPVGAIPAGFGWSVVGVVAFCAVGLLDLAWHLAFGLEADTEALLSPTHLGLGMTSALIASGPLRAAWGRRDEHARTGTWSSMLPALLAVVAIAGVAAFALHPVNLFVDAWPRWPYGRFDATWYGPNIGIAGAIVPTLIVTIPLLELLRRWPVLPAGSATLLVGATMAGLTFLHDGQVLIGAPILGGFLIDVVLLAVPRGPMGRWLVGGLGPAVLFAAYFLVVAASGPVTWSAHLIGGTIVIAGVTGLALALLARQPRPPADHRPEVDSAPDPGLRSADN